MKTRTDFMKMAIISTAIFVYFGANAMAQSHYRVYKGDEEYLGVLSKTDTPEPLSNSIVVISCQGAKEGPFRKSDGYHWSRLKTSPCFKPIHLRPSDVAAFKDVGIVLGNTRTFAYANTNNGIFVVTTAVDGTGEDLGKLHRLLPSFTFPKTTASKELYLQYTVRPNDPKADISIVTADSNLKAIAGFEVDDSSRLHSILENAADNTQRERMRAGAPKPK